MLERRPPAALVLRDSGMEEEAEEEEWRRRPGSEAVAPARQEPRPPHPEVRRACVRAARSAGAPRGGSALLGCGGGGTPARSACFPRLRLLAPALRPRIPFGTRARRLEEEDERGHLWFRKS